MPITIHSKHYNGPVRKGQCPHLTGQNAEMSNSKVTELSKMASRLNSRSPGPKVPSCFCMKLFLDDEFALLYSLQHGQLQVLFGQTPDVTILFSKSKGKDRV